MTTIVRMSIFIIVLWRYLIYWRCTSAAPSLDLVPMSQNRDSILQDILSELKTISQRIERLENEERSTLEAGGTTHPGANGAETRGLRSWSHLGVLGSNIPCFRF